MVSWHSRQVCKHHTDLHIAAKTDKDSITQVVSAQQKLEGKVRIFQPNCRNMQCLDTLLFSSSGESECLFGFCRNPYLLFRGKTVMIPMMNWAATIEPWGNISKKLYIYHCNSRQKADRKCRDDNIRTEGWRKKWEGDRGGSRTSWNCWCNL